jgi:hypothetical protein
MVFSATCPVLPEALSMLDFITCHRSGCLPILALALLLPLAGCKRPADVPPAADDPSAGPATVAAPSLTPGAETPLQPADPPAGALRVLFIGNSLTASNDLPGILRGLSAGGNKPIATASVVQPGASLEDQWNQGAAQKAIGSGKWDFVILQQGPSSQPESRVVLREYTRRFAEEIKKVGARPALYMVWPSTQRAKDFDAVVESYALAAKDVGGVLLPVGDAWRAAWRLDPKLELYASDGLHPSATGSFLAALVMYERLCGRPLAKLPAGITIPGPTGEKLRLTADRAMLLRSAASEANGKTRP